MLVQARHLGLVLHPFTSRWRMLAVLIAYIDESGAHGGPDDVFTVGGFVARDERWRRIEGTWNRLLARRVFHMVDFENRCGEFEDWPTERRRIVLISGLADSLRGNVAIGIAHSVPFKDFREEFCPSVKHQKAVLRLAYSFLLKS